MDVVKLLLENGALVNGTTEKGSTPLMAALSGYYNVYTFVHIIMRKKIPVARQSLVCDIRVNKNTLDRDIPLQRGRKLTLYFGHTYQVQ